MDYQQGQPPRMPEPTFYSSPSQWNDGSNELQDYRHFAQQHRDSSYSLASTSPAGYDEPMYPDTRYSAAESTGEEESDYDKGYPESVAPTFTDFSTAPRPQYPAWAERDIPISQEEIEDIFIDLAQKFGFQDDSKRNMYDFFMLQLDSRASRMTPNQALLTLHADYIGGENANFRKWYFAAQLDLDDVVGHVQRPGLQRMASIRKQQPSKASNVRSLHDALDRWRTTMENLSPYDRVRQVALYLLCWGEAAQMRLTPECLCFIFKCADDYYRSPECQERTDPVPDGQYLRTVILPLYRFIRDQGYEYIDKKWVRRERDHQDIIGYDDVNQLFWYPEGISRIVMFDGKHLVEVAKPLWYTKFEKIDWQKTFRKTYYERRSGVHLLVNFNRIWVIHIAVYWFYTAWNSETVYTPRGGTTRIAMRLSATALGGAVATLIMILATIAEFAYIEATWRNAAHLLRRTVFLLAILAITACPTIYVALVDAQSSGAIIVAAVQFSVSVIATIMFGIIPSGRMFGDRVAGKSRKYLASQTFTASYADLSRSARTVSIALWSAIFACKLVESYFFLTLPFSAPISLLVHMRVSACVDTFFGNHLCKYQPVFALAIMYIMDLVLFFLDTFLWYVIWNTILSICRAFMLGLSLWTPWTYIYTCLPKRIYSKLLFTEDMDARYLPKVLVSQVWNAIIISMYREHLLSIRHVQHLLYHQAPDESGKRSLRTPLFFTGQNDPRRPAEFFPRDSEAERRISFFAQSMTTVLPRSIPVDAMPTFTVLTPHYSEKILLSLREIIREEDRTSRVTLLEYLKQLSPIEWDNFVTDTKILAAEGDVFDGPSPFDNDDRVNKNNDLPLYEIGFKTASPEYTLRLRIWASLRAQTLYRTVAGMMNYSKAIKLLYRVENPEVVQLFDSTEKLEKELERMAKRKFKFVVSMQRYAKFNPEEIENAEFLLRAYPELQIAYLHEEPPKEGRGENRIFSALIDGHCELGSDGKRKPKFKIELPGNPILGDGKSDNQNHAIIFYRGEYLQVIDANQDNYLEECLKIRNVLGEFEEYELQKVDAYAPGRPAPIAIVGAREYIFSENIGILGDVAAGKEQTFGTMTHRALAWIGGRLHYGHPDFLNAIFMNTRGGVSKAQKGLHLNEDIFAGMTAFARGGRIKHMEYYQCGKGRDLGFGTILNFQTKLGHGMGEQLLSREYYYLGTQLPIDRFLTFYYAHPGFHVNNILIMISVQTFMICMLYIGTLNSTLPICTGPDAIRRPNNCYYITPVYEWVEHCIISIFLVFFVAFLPLFLTELSERGAAKAILRLAKQLGSFSYVFEVFSTQIQSHSVLSNLAFGGARYIATGRGFATTRIPFSILFARFAGPSIYLGIRTMLMLFYVSLTLWTPWLIYFWVSVLALSIAPFVFNPDQFSFMDFIIDYRELLRWMSRGNSLYHKNSWIGYCRLSRISITGYKKKKLGHPSEKLSGDVPRASWRAVLFSEIIQPIFMAVLFVIAYMFVKAVPMENGDAPPSPLVRILIVALCPIAWNAAILLIFFFVSVTFGPWFPPTERKKDTDARPPPSFGSYIAAIVHALGLVGAVGFFELFWILELWEVSHAVLGLIAIIAIQRAVYKAVTSLVLSREFKHDESNRAWWTGVWYGRDLGIHVFSQPAREWIVKIVELSLWTSDFLICHLIYFFLALPTLVPYIDRIHPILLFWLRPSKQIRPPVFSMRLKEQRRRYVVKYGLIFVSLFAVFAVLIVVPLALRKHIKLNCSICNNF